MRKECPVCHSHDVKIKENGDINFLVCNKCGFDESKEYDVYTGEKGSKKAKARYSPYKIGGSQRTRR